MYILILGLNMRVEMLNVICIPTCISGFLIISRTAQLRKVDVVSDPAIRMSMSDDLRLWCPLAPWKEDPGALWAACFKYASM